MKSQLEEALAAAAKAQEFAKTKEMVTTAIGR